MNRILPRFRVCFVWTTIRVDCLHIIWPLVPFTSGPLSEVLTHQIWVLCYFIFCFCVHNRQYTSTGSSSSWVKYQPNKITHYFIKQGRFSISFSFSLSSTSFLIFWGWRFLLSLLISVRLEFSMNWMDVTLKHECRGVNNKHRVVNLTAWRGEIRNLANLSQIPKSKRCKFSFNFWSSMYAYM